jgi:hypothetical protein
MRVTIPIIDQGGPLGSTFRQIQDLAINASAISEPYHGRTAHDPIPAFFCWDVGGVDTAAASLTILRYKPAKPMLLLGSIPFAVKPRSDPKPSFERGSPARCLRKGSNKALQVDLADHASSFWQ